MGRTILIKVKRFLLPYKRSDLSCGYFMANLLVRLFPSLLDRNNISPINNNDRRSLSRRLKVKGLSPKVKNKTIT